MLRPIELTRAFETGHEKTDDEHREILKSCGEMIALQSVGQLTDCSREFGACIKQCEDHFDGEKQFLEGSNTATAKAHLVDHAVILDKLTTMHKDCNKGCTGGECLSEIMHTLVRHILKHDIALHRKFDT
jgi:hemerythrin-like metal-binding protein